MHFFMDLYFFLQRIFIRNFIILGHVAEDNVII